MSSTTHVSARQASACLNGKGKKCQRRFMTKHVTQIDMTILMQNPEKKQRNNE